MKNIVVTGGSGKAGTIVCQSLVEHGYLVLNIDSRPPVDPCCAFLNVDLEDLGQTVEAFRATGGNDHPFRKFKQPDAVVHLAAIRAPDLYPDCLTFRNNIMSTYNVFEAAALVGIKRVVWASSETTLGLPFSAEAPPDYVPVDEDHPLRPESAYSLSKVLSEEMARQMHRWNPDMSFIGLRLSNVMTSDDYLRFPDWQGDASIRKWNMWGYIDARDFAQSVRKSLIVENIGAEYFIIANADSVMTRSNEELMAEVFPGVTMLEGSDGHKTLLSIEKARRVLGYEPEYSWRSNNLG
ncbi:MAG: NAD(P)-dependent oxidoreductase [Alphaproteobacteria bacterium]|jgi:nucleoside-diphosphate-sugar epimerase|nr:NAD(P)-dependent oxidoreductase [Alphaproteobacteria bacterium]MBT4019871.1 NAD(P)-dependent oxidoreductase [Alphaproteobacteria bacterium]MBT4966134.1 NAD(P)-dependent oxidoreductase [Alphaproteobacteria bacterium]MBT5159406.1 NAD(P)-dependent oxidoreductase [Alphaproteobacteria bacterium]MBT7747019.1 NAD(P)-dependent oxidoreductase [Alphaproteobacteria bacterium]